VERDLLRAALEKTVERSLSWDRRIENKTRSDERGVWPERRDRAKKTVSLAVTHL